MPSDRATTSKLTNNIKKLNYPTHAGNLSLKLKVQLGAPNKVIISLFL
jgi:hypothetical protein